jgi:radical SAM protein with 4Fe4S-binding SPASM domain
MPKNQKTDGKKAQKHDAQKMAELVERWLGNPVSKKILRFCTKKCKCGRRNELVLKDYSGEKQKMCSSCKFARFIIGKVIDSFIEKSGADRKEIMENLKDPMWRKGLSSVMEGVALYGPTKPFTSSAPFLVVWNVTKGCNLACKHCYEDAHVPAPDELTPKEALEAVDKMADAGVAYIAISGGEPLTRPDFFDIAKRIKEREMAFSIATNGTLMTKEMVRKLKEVNCIYFQISLDGAKAETHDSFRGRDVFAKTLEGIKNAVDSGVKVGLAMTVTKYNLKEVREAIDLAEKLGVSIFMHYNFIPVGRGNGIVDMDITPQEREELLKYFASQIGKRKVTILSTAPQFARVCTTLNCPGTSMTHFDTFSQKDEYGTTQFLAEFVGGCGTARLYCALEPNGDVEPCVFIPIKCGNLRHDSLVDIWRNSPVMKALRDRKNFKGTCKTCKFTNVCGGCRARAYGYYRDVQQSDPGCILNVREWEKIKAETK